MKDISHQTLEGLIEFIYMGEVTVHQESLADFLNTAKSLKIKGLIDQNYLPASAQDQPIQSKETEFGYNNRNFQYQSIQTNQRKRFNDQSLNPMIFESTAESSETSLDHHFKPNYSFDTTANEFPLDTFNFESNDYLHFIDDYNFDNYQMDEKKYSTDAKSTAGNGREHFVDKKVVKLKPAHAKYSRKIGNVNNDFNVVGFVH